MEKISYIKFKRDNNINDRGTADSILRKRGYVKIGSIRLERGEKPLEVLDAFLDRIENKLLSDFKIVYNIFNVGSMLRWLDVYSEKKQSKG